MIQSKAGWNFVGIYADYAKSGNKRKKGVQSLKRMLDDCETGEIDIICTKSISRFARNTVECIQIVRKLKEKNIDVYFEKKTSIRFLKRANFCCLYTVLLHRQNQKVSRQIKKGDTEKILDGTLHSVKSCLWVSHRYSWIADTRTRESSCCQIYIRGISGGEKEHG